MTSPGLSRSLEATCPLGTRRQVTAPNTMPAPRLCLKSTALQASAQVSGSNSKPLQPSGTRCHSSPSHPNRDSKHTEAHVISCFTWTGLICTLSRTTRFPRAKSLSGAASLSPSAGLTLGGGHLPVPQRRADTRGKAVPQHRAYTRGRADPQHRAHTRISGGNTSTSSETLRLPGALGSEGREACALGSGKPTIRV